YNVRASRCTGRGEDKSKRNRGCIACVSARVVERRLSKPPAADDHATTARIGAAPTHSLRTRIRRGAAQRWRDHPLQTATGCPQRLRPRCPAIPAGPPRAGSRNAAAYELYQEPNERQRQTQRPPRTSLYAILCTASWRVPIPARATVMMTSGGSASIHVMAGNCFETEIERGAPTLSTAPAATAAGRWTHDPRHRNGRRPLHDGPPAGARQAAGGGASPIAGFAAAGATHSHQPPPPPSLCGPRAAAAAAAAAARRRRCAPPARALRRLTTVGGGRRHASPGKREEAVAVGHARAGAVRVGGGRAQRGGETGEPREAAPDPAAAGRPRRAPRTLRAPAGGDEGPPRATRGGGALHDARSPPRAATRVGPRLLVARRRGGGGGCARAPRATRATVGRARLVSAAPRARRRRRAPRGGGPRVSVDATPAG
ncbi:hypothetical protein BU14_0488s0014, partial [Porphyra umbilicalis]